MKTKILIAGLGGVGGYYGGLLARKYNNDVNIEINFLARGEHLRQIQQNGLKVITETDEFISIPSHATDNCSSLGHQDFILLSTKSYDLEQTIEQLKPCIKPETVILPLLNGADISQRIRKLLPEIEVWEGCVYIVGRLKSPGIVQSSGGVHDFFFGYNTSNREKLETVYNWLKSAGIKVTLSEDIRMIIWRKFIFISTTATLTSYYNVGFRDLLTDKERKETTIKYMKEVAALAIKEGVQFKNDIVETTLQHIERLPFDTTSSMHSDFLAKRNTELETLTGIVIKLGKQYNVSTPTCESIYNQLKNT